MLYAYILKKTKSSRVAERKVDYDNEMDAAVMPNVKRQKSNHILVPSQSIQPVQSTTPFGHSDSRSFDQNEALTVQSWLQGIRLAQYYDTLVKNGFESMSIIVEISDKKQLSEIDIISIKHQEIFMKEIQKFKNAKHTGAKLQKKYNNDDLVLVTPDPFVDDEDHQKETNDNMADGQLEVK